MTGKAKFNLDEYILDVCTDAGVKPDIDIFHDKESDSVGFSISYFELLKCVIILNRDPAFNRRALTILNNKKKFYKFLESNKISEGLVPKPIMVKYCKFIESIFKRGQFITDLSLSKQLQDDIDIAASSDLSVFISGETGTGKELTARTIHDLSHRSKRPFMPVNCAQYAKSALLDSILFGYVEGSHNQAFKDKDGLLKTANGGTLFLDEIGDADQSTQTMLLRYLNEKEYYPLGATTPIQSNVRIICATNKFDASEVKSGKANLRSDLYFRVSEHEINLPPLKRHKASIPLITYIITEKVRKNIKFHSKIEFPLILIYAWIKFYNFPGNYRELTGFIEDYVRKFIYWKQNKSEDYSILKYAMNPQLELARKKHRISQKNIELINLVGFTDIIDKLPPQLCTSVNHDYLLWFPYLQWALFDINKQHPVKKSKHVRPEHLEIYSFQEYYKYSTVKPTVSADHSHILDAMFSEKAKLNTPLKELVKDGITRKELMRLYYNQFIRVTPFDTRHELATKLDYTRQERMSKFFKDYNLNWPEWLLK